MSGHNPALKAAILEIVENQLNENDPPITKKTLKRLMKSGYSRQEAVELIGSTAVHEIWNVLANKEPFDLHRYTKLLKELK